MTEPEARLAAALPCEDLEEPCDADGRDAHRWCDSCIARHRIAANPTLAADLALAAAMRRWYGDEFTDEDIFNALEYDL